MQHAILHKMFVTTMLVILLELNRSLYEKTQNELKALNMNYIMNVYQNNKDRMEKEGLGTNNWITNLNT